MGYVARQLSDGERVEFSTTLHPIILVVPMLVGGILLVVGLLMLFEEPASGIALLLPGALVVGAGWLRFISAEFAVTDRRLIIKVGFVRRRSMETLLTKVEGVQVNQGFLGRMLDYGTIKVTGTGGSSEEFQLIQKPLEFRRQVQDAVSSSHVRGAQEHLSALAGAQPQRDSVGQLERLAKLRDQGALTQEEFEREKRKVLDS